MVCSLSFLTFLSQVGTEVEFALTSVNVVGKSSDRSESSPVYRVIGATIKDNDEVQDEINGYNQSQLPCSKFYKYNQY